MTYEDVTQATCWDLKRKLSQHYEICDDVLQAIDVSTLAQMITKLADATWRAAATPLDINHEAIGMGR